MSNTAAAVESIVKKHGRDTANLIEIIRDVQSDLGQVSRDAITKIAEGLNVSAVDVEGVVTFYHFFSEKPVGKYTVFLNNSAVSVMMGQSKIARAFENEVGCKFGEVSKDGKIGLFNTSCIGMNDQEPAAIINGVIFTSLTPEKVKKIVAGMKGGKDIARLVKEYGDGKNQSELIKSMVNNNIRKTGAVLLSPYKSGSALKKAVSMKPEDVIEEIKISNLRGRGGAGFPTGMKWEFTRKNARGKCYVVCNADEGEPGTFKDRVILTEIPEMLFEGMAIGGYAIGAEEGIIYLRAEYLYLKDYLENVLKSMRKKNLLGKNIEGKKNFNFDITIKTGAGAYVCGEESALIESAEGKRGEPRNRPPFPAQYGYLGVPTTVNNVESFCATARIIVEGGEWYTRMGTAQSKGTKLLSVSGDCKKPGIYEVEFGTTVQTLIEEADARNAVAVQMGGPSGTCISKKEFSRRICYDDLATGGSVIIIGPDRDILKIVNNFMDFFIEESCGWCVPCRAGNVVLKHKLEKIMKGAASETDLKEIEEWGRMIKCSSRCGLGQTSPNPILTTIKNFREIYKSRLKKNEDFVSDFDLAASVQESCKAAGRKPNLQGH